MPFYEYACDACEHQFEALQKISDDPLVECPECHKKRLKKLVSAPSFQLKGDGWYVTDFRDKDKKDTSKSSDEKKTEKPSNSESTKASTSDE